MFCNCCYFCTRQGMPHYDNGSCHALLCYGPSKRCQRLMWRKLCMSNILRRYDVTQYNWRLLDVRVYVCVFKAGYTFINHDSNYINQHLTTVMMCHNNELIRDRDEEFPQLFALLCCKFLIMFLFHVFILWLAVK